MSFDPTTWGSALGVGGGWLAWVITAGYVIFTMVRGGLVSSKTVSSILKVHDAALTSVSEARDLWQKAAMEQLAINDLERETSRRISAAVEATLKVVTDLQAANEARYRDLGGEHHGTLPPSQP